MLHYTGLLLASMATICVTLTNFDCESMQPNTDLTQFSSENFRFTITNEDGLPTSKFNDQTGLTVKLSGEVSFNRFILQCRVPSTATPVGKWIAIDDKQKAVSCGALNDTLVNNGELNLKQLTARWVPLGDEAQRIDEIEFTVTVTTGDLKYSTDIRSIIVELEKANHGLDDEVKKQREYNIKIVKLGEDEQRTGEEEIGEEIKEREEEEKRREKERRDAEINEYNEKIKNQNRIMEELKNKEDYIREEIRKNAMKKAFATTDSAVSVGSGIITTSLCLAFIYL